MKYAILILLTLPLFLYSQLPPIGIWREHLSYQSAIQVIKGDKIYCATNNAVYSVEGNEIERYSRITGLNETGVSCIAWDDGSQQLIVAYTNSNIDVIKGNIVKNIGDIARSTIIGNKIVNSIYCQNGIAYLSTGLGIILVDVIKYEVKDTWFIGNSGNQLAVNNLIKNNNFFYAATKEGLKKASINANLANYNNWIKIAKNVDVKAVFNCNNKIFFEKNDSIFWLKNDTTFSFIYTKNNWHITTVNSTQNNIFITLLSLNGKSNIEQIDDVGNVEKVYENNNLIINPKSVIQDGNDLWIADAIAGLSKNVTESFVPNGPPSTADGQMIFANNNLYVAAGSINENWNYQQNRNGIYTFSEDIWTAKNYYNTPTLDSVLDFISLANNKINNTIWAGSYWGGLVAFKEDSVVIFKKNNSTLQSTIGDQGTVRISGLAFDKNNYLWISNFGAAAMLHVKKPDNTFKAIEIPYSLNQNAVAQIVVDDNNNIWILCPQLNGLICFNYGNNIDDINGYQWQYYKKGNGQGNLPSNTIVCIAKDLNNIIWVGTDNGIAIIPCTEEVFNNNCPAILPVVKSGQLTGYLFQNQRINCIVVDATNRKWIATKSGVWLISADGDKIIEKFTQTNSSLLSNDVKQIAINPQNGEIFFATQKGICSYRGTAIEADDNNNNVLVFPNPVPPNYSVTIGIKGVPNNCVVKITELNGRLVYQTRSLGGQAIWNGYNYKNEKIANGIYLVFVKDDLGSEKLVTKIVMMK